MHSCVAPVGCYRDGDRCGDPSNNSSAPRRSPTYMDKSGYRLAIQRQTKTSATTRANRIGRFFRAVLFAFTTETCKGMRMGLIESRAMGQCRRAVARWTRLEENTRVLLVPERCGLEEEARGLEEEAW